MLILVVQNDGPVHAELPHSLTDIIRIAFECELRSVNPDYHETVVAVHIVPGPKMGNGPNAVHTAVCPEVQQHHLASQVIHCDDAVLRRGSQNPGVEPLPPCDDFRRLTVVGETSVFQRDVEHDPGGIGAHRTCVIHSAGIRTGTGIVGLGIFGLGVCEPGIEGVTNRLRVLKRGESRPVVGKNIQYRRLKPAVPAETDGHSHQYHEGTEHLLDFGGISGENRHPFHQRSATEHDGKHRQGGAEGIRKNDKHRPSVNALGNGETDDRSHDRTDTRGPHKAKTQAHEQAARKALRGGATLPAPGYPRSYYLESMPQAGNQHDQAEEQDESDSGNSQRVGGNVQGPHETRQEQRKNAEADDKTRYDSERPALSADTS